MRRYSEAAHVLREARREAGLTSTEVAAELLSASRLSEYENGKRDLQFGTMLKILAATDHTVKLVDAVDSEFPNRYLTARTFPAHLDYADAILQTPDDISR